MLKKLILVIICIFILSGCTALIGIIGGGGSPGLTFEAVHKGTEGLKMSFLENQPLSNYKVAGKGTPIIISLSLENMGAIDLVKGTTIAINTDKSYIVLDNDRTDVELAGRTIESPTGEKGVVTFTGMVQPLKIDEDETVIDATACYRYSVEGHYSVCIDTDTANLRSEKKACSYKDNSKLSSLSGQGGPVGASEIEVVLKEDLNSVKPQFIVHIKNFGRGRIFNAFIIPSDLCSSALKDASSLNVVFVNAKLADKTFKCEPNPVILDPESEDNYVVCSNEAYSIPSGTSSFWSSLLVYIVYDYVDTTSKQITIQRIKTTN